MTASSLSPNGAPSAAVPASWETKPSEQRDGTGSGRPNPWTLRTTFRVYRAPISITYALITVENVLRLGQPTAIGLAVNDLLTDSYRGALVFAVIHLLHLAISTARRMYDTRTYASIYTDLVSKLVVEQRGRKTETSRVAARSTLSRELVDFFEQDVPNVLNALFSLLGALVMLAVFDVWLASLCLALVVPTWVINSSYSRQVLRLSRQLNDEIERDVAVIDRGLTDEVRAHYEGMAHWRVRLSDCEALNVSLTELFIMGLMVMALVRSCSVSPTSPGNIFAIFRYVLMFIMGLDRVPVLVRQVSRLRDICRRINGGPYPEAQPRGNDRASAPGG